MFQQCMQLMIRIPPKNCDREMKEPIHICIILKTLIIKNTLYNN